MFIPIGDINPKEKTPYVNYLIIGVNVAVYLLFAFRDDYDMIVRQWGYIPAGGDFITIFTSMFLHANLFHLLGNMLFLWITGDNVEDKLGHISYLFFYLSGGVVATLVHDSFSSSVASMIPTIGASGAIASVMAAYLVLFPRNKIIVFYWVYFFMGKLYMDAFWFFGLWILFQVIYAKTLGMAGGGVAYGAHIGGFLFGVIIIIALLAAGVIKKSPQRKFHL